MKKMLLAIVIGLGFASTADARWHNVGVDIDLAGCQLKPAPTIVALTDPDDGNVVFRETTGEPVILIHKWTVNEAVVHCMHKKGYAIDIRAGGNPHVSDSYFPRDMRISNSQMSCQIAQSRYAKSKSGRQLNALAEDEEKWLFACMYAKGFVWIEE